MDSRADDVEIREYGQETLSDEPLMPLTPGVDPEGLSGATLPRSGRFAPLDEHADVSLHTGEPSIARADTWQAATGEEPPPPDSAETAAIRNTIEDTRDQLSGTIDAIQQRLNPETLKAQARETVQEAAQEVTERVRAATIGRAETVVNDVTDSAKGAGNIVFETIRQNPLPTALATLGLGWLIARGRSTAQAKHDSVRGASAMSSSHLPAQGTGYYPTYTAYDAPYTPGGASQAGQGTLHQAANTAQQKTGQLADTVQQKTGQLADTVQQKTGQLTDTVQSTTSQVANQVASQAGQLASQAQDQVQYQSRRAQGWFQQTLDQNPLVLGAIALAVGTAVGLGVPETPKEDQVFGSTRDSLMERAQGAAHDTVQRVQQVAQEAGSAAKDAAQDAAQASAQQQGLTPQPSTQNGKQNAAAPKNSK